ncbi:MAG: hypothetical protein JWN85_4104 [Gammaproteobacteria bacterium]|nr:hypothetical protein [Gammaproteobacteria bacterium]
MLPAQALAAHAHGAAERQFRDGVRVSGMEVGETAAAVSHRSRCSLEKGRADGPTCNFVSFATGRAGPAELKKKYTDSPTGARQDTQSHAGRRCRAPKRQNSGKRLPCASVGLPEGRNPGARTHLQSGGGSRCVYIADTPGGWKVPAIPTGCRRVAADSHPSRASREPPCGAGRYASGPAATWAPTRPAPAPITNTMRSGGQKRLRCEVANCEL